MPPRTNEEVKAHRIFQMLPNNSKRIVLNGPLLGGQERGNAGNYNPKTGQYRYLPSRNEYLDLLNRIHFTERTPEQERINLNRLEFIRGKHLKDALPMRQEVIDRRVAKQSQAGGKKKKATSSSSSKKKVIKK